MVAGVFAVMLLRNQKSAPLAPEMRAIRRLEQRLAQLGFVRGRGETLGGFFGRIQHSAPQLQTSLDNIHGLFNAVAYQSQREKIVQLETAIKQFRTR